MSAPRRSCIALVASLATACGDGIPADLDAALPDAHVPDASTEDYLTSRMQGQPGKPRVLVYTFENYWRHFSGVECMVAYWTMVSTHGFTVLTSNHPRSINAKNLADVDVVAWCVTSGLGLDAQSKADYEAWTRAGGGSVGFHSATATEWSWPFYVAHVGTLFAGHADGLWPATVTIESTTHPITAGMTNFDITEEWYNFSQRPETIEGAQMLLAVDEATLPPEYPAGAKAGYHPIAWANDRFGGRMFYTSLGHAPETFREPYFYDLIVRATEWAARQR